VREEDSRIRKNHPSRTKKDIHVLVGSDIFLLKNINFVNNYFQKHRYFEKMLTEKEE
jgi:hypothetical protein